MKIIISIRSKIKQVVMGWQNQTGLGGIVFLWLPFFLFFSLTGWLGPIKAMITGELFDVQPMKNSWPWFMKYIVSAVISLDFRLFSFFSINAMLTSIFIYLVSNLKERKNYVAFALPFGFIVFWAICMLAGPSADLIRYIRVTGMTPRCQEGIYFIVASVVIWTGVSIFLLWRRSAKYGAIINPTNKPPK